MQNGRVALGLMERARERDLEEPPRIRVKPEDWEV